MLCRACQRTSSRWPTFPDEVTGRFRPQHTAAVRLLGVAESVLCICDQLSFDLPQGDKVAAFIKFKGGGTF